jgi:acetyltransferase-like isoleucine patch superfamily enzyme
MLNLIALLTKKKYWLLHSLFIKGILRLYGISVGVNFYIEGTPKLKINGRPENICIGNNVSILGAIDLRNRENGAIIFHDNVVIERDCRFVAAMDGSIIVGEETIITAFAIINGGGDVVIGEKCVLGPRIIINANDHLTARDTYIRDQGFMHEPVSIGDDCWTGANVVINKGVTLAQGTVVGANAVVTGDTREYSINVGVPAREIALRS